MSKKGEHINAVIRNFQESVRDKAAMAAAFKTVAKEYGVNESTVRDKCTRGLGYTADEFFSAVTSFLDCKSDELVNHYPHEEVEELYSLLTENAVRKPRASGGRLPVMGDEVAVRCACGTILPTDTNFCPSCGTAAVKRGPAVKSAPHLPDNWLNGFGTIMESEQEVSEMETRYTAPDGVSAIINGIVYLLIEQKIYKLDINGGGELELLLSQRDFFVPDLYLPSPDDDGRIDCISGLKRFECWNGKIVFYAGCEKIPGMRFNDCGGDERSIYGMFSYDTSTRELTYCSAEWTDDDWVPYEGKAYHIDNRENQFVSRDIVTGEVTCIPMPKVTLADWPGAAEDAGKRDVTWAWDALTVWGGSVYTSVKNAWGYLSMRFPMENPEAYTPLPYGACTLGYETFGRACIFAPSANALIVPKGCSDRGRHAVCALSMDTMEEINIENQPGEVIYLDLAWTQYGDYLAVSDSAEQESLIFKISNAKYIGTASVRYAGMLCAFRGKTTTYAIGFRDGGARHSNDWFGELYLYTLPNDKLFKAETNLNEYARPLFT